MVVVPILGPFTTLSCAVTLNCCTDFLVRCFFPRRFIVNCCIPTLRNKCRIGLPPCPNGQRFNLPRTPRDLAILLRENVRLFPSPWRLSQLLADR